MTAGQRRDLMEIVDDRHGRKATIVTSQLPVEKWYDIIGDPTFADAILDRLVHHAHRIELDGPRCEKTRRPTPWSKPTRPHNDNHVPLRLCPQGPPTRPSPPAI